MQSSQLAALVFGVHRLWQQPVGDPSLSHKCRRMTKHWLRTDSSILKGTYYVFPFFLFFSPHHRCTPTIQHQTEQTRSDSIRRTDAHGAAGRRSNPEKPPQDLTLEWLSLILGGFRVCVRACVGNDSLPISGQLPWQQKHERQQQLSCFCSSK